MAEVYSYRDRNTSRTSLRNQLQPTHGVLPRGTSGTNLLSNRYPKCSDAVLAAWFGISSELEAFRETTRKTIEENEGCEHTPGMPPGILVFIMAYMFSPEFVESAQKQLSAQRLRRNNIVSTVRKKTKRIQHEEKKKKEV